MGVGGAKKLAPEKGLNLVLAKWSRNGFELALCSGQSLGFGECDGLDVVCSREVDELGVGTQ